MVECSLSFRVRRFLVLVLVVMLAFGPITRAYADDYEGGGGASQSFNSSFGTVWYGPTASGLYVRYGVVANTRYDAAVYCCRGRSFDLNDLTATKKSKLLNDGDFKQFAELFNASKPELTDDWSGDASIVMAWNSAKQLYGETYCWNARYTNDQKIRAQEAIEDVLNDEDTPSGGGGGSGTGTTVPDFDGDYVNLSFIVYYAEDRDSNDRRFKINNIAYYYNMVQEPRIGDPIKVRLTRSVYNEIVSHEGYFLGVMGGADLPRLYVGYTKGTDGTVTWEGSNYKYFKFNGYWYEKLLTLSLVGDASDYDNNEPYFYSNTASLGQLDEHYNSRGQTSSAPIVAAIIDGTSTGIGGGGDGGGDDPEPPIDWPAPPTETPTPPEVPTPGDPTTPIPPDPVDPTPGNPWIPIPDEDISITGEDFQDLIDALNEHCIHLQNSIQSNVSQLWDLQSDFLGTQFSDLFGQISDNFTWLGNDVITESYNDLKSYLHELFEWLSDQLNFDVQVEGGQYDDTSVLYWLKQIWAKLPTGINTRPTDPVTNPTGWWDWLTQLLNNLAADLMMLGQDRLAGVLETLNQLRSKFPFSLPWDVAALLGLLVGEPACPEFDVPCYTVSLDGLQEVGTYHITLEPYETVWQGVKWMETLAFSVYLIMNTSGLMDMVSKTVRPR